jgi:hypothetical protein
VTGPGVCTGGREHEKTPEFPGVLPRLCDGAFFFSIRLHITLHFAGAQALGAYGHADRRAVFVDAHPLQVGRPGPPGLPVRVAYPVAGHHAFIANCAASCHIFPPPDIVCGQSKSQTKVFYHPAGRLASQIVQMSCIVGTNAEKLAVTGIIQYNTVMVIVTCGYGMEVEGWEQP